jgi:uncharacterized membrane protein required for colicin V production
MTFAQIFDIGAACVLAFFVVRGLLRGLTGEIVSLLGLVASVACGWMFAQPAAGIVLRYFPNWDRTPLELACSVVIFMAVSLAFAVVSKILRTLVRAAGLTLLDHFLGAFSGCARAFIAALFIYGAVTLFSPVVPSQWMKESVAMRTVSFVWPPVFEILTEKGWLRLDGLVPETLAETGLPAALDALPSFR